MAGKISELSAMTTGQVALPDLFEILDVSDTSMAATGTNKKMAWSDLAISMGVPRMGCAMTQSGQSIPTGAVANLTWDNEISDPLGMHAPGGYTITIPAGGDGLWAVTANVTGPQSIGVSNVAISVNGALKTAYIPADKATVVNSIIQPLGATDTIIIVIYNSHSVDAFFTGSLDVNRVGL